MSFDDIVTGLERAWSFLAPPIVRLSTTLALTYFIAPVLFLHAAETIIRLTNPTLLSDQRFTTALEFYGLSKVIPVAFAILIIALLKFVQNLMLWIGYLVPPNIFATGLDVFTAAARLPDIKVLWQRHRSANDLSSLVSLLKTQFQSLDVHARKDFEYWTLEGKHMARLFNTAKFLTVWSLSIAVAANAIGATKGGELARALALVPVFVACSLYAVAKYLYSFMQQEYAFVRAMLAIEQTPSKECNVDAKTDDQIDKDLEALRQLKPVRWWSIRFLDLTTAKWIWQQTQPMKFQ